MKWKCEILRLTSSTDKGLRSEDSVPKMRTFRNKPSSNLVILMYWAYVWEKFVCLIKYQNTTVIHVCNLNILRDYIYR